MKKLYTEKAIKLGVLGGNKIADMAILAQDSDGNQLLAIITEPDQDGWMTVHGEAYKSRKVTSGKFRIVKSSVQTKDIETSDELALVNVAVAATTEENELAGFHILKVGTLEEITASKLSV